MMSSNGDRWDKGSTLVVGGGSSTTTIDVATADCLTAANAEDLVLGAASLVAGSVALAAALAF
jgi:hypothetical protein